MKPENKRSFWALIVTQFFGAFNDNVLKVLVTLLLVLWVSDTQARNSLVSFSGAVFVAPFLLFSMIAGRLADRVAKPRVAVATKFWELIVIAVAILGLLNKSIPVLMGALFLLSTQATFFSPAKYGVLPEMMGESELPVANAYLNIFTFAAILVGTLVGSFLAEKLGWACAIMACASVAGLAASHWIRPLPPAKPDEVWAWNPLKDLIANWALIRKDRALKLGVIAVNYFWFMGAILQLNIFLYASEMMKASPKVSGLLVMGVAVGVGVGSWMCGKLSRGKVELGLVPIGAFGMSLFAVDLLWAYHSYTRTAFDFFMLGLAGGFYDIPLMALIQWRSPAAERGRIMATVNFLSFVAILIASGILWFLANQLHQNPAQVFFSLGLISLVGTAIVSWFIPDALIRFVFYVLTNVFYRVRIVGEDLVPATGPALLVSNHLSLVDGFLVGTSIPRPVRFLIWRPYYEAKWFGWIARTMKAIPISESDPPKEILRSLMAARKALEDGHLVCIFAEGAISRTGNLLEFKKGIEVILKGLEVPVIPVHLDRVWGSIFSFEHGRVLFKRPRRIPYPVTVTFGPPVAPPINAGSVRQAVLDLSAEAFRLRLEERQTLAIEFVKRAKRQPRALAVADSSGKELSFGSLAALSFTFGELLFDRSSSSAADIGRGSISRVIGPPPETAGDDGSATECVGLLLPPSVGGVIANLAVSLFGRVPVNLNYTAGAAAIDQAVTKAKIARILTTRPLLQKAGIAEKPGMIFIEDLIPKVSRTKVALRRAFFGLLFTRAAVRTFTRNQGRLDDTATVMFSSGSTGIPKGVVLSHANILANVLGLGQVFDVGPNDRMIGVLPFFHSFGFTGTLWFPLLSGFAGVYHTNPLDAKRVGELSGKYSASLLLATPTFLSAYTRKCLPEQFRHQRFVITGAERLRESIAKAFEEKFGVAPLEGYGCTELSPVVAANVPNVSMGEIRQVGRKSGMIGHPIPGVTVRIVHPESFEPVAQGEQGLLIVKGPNVMKGYLDEPQKTAEVLRDGWYITGDIAVIDPDGFIRLVDRLSRFSKVGGEMVPHVKLEEKLHEIAGRTDPTFVVTGVPDEKRGEELVVLYVNGVPSGVDVDEIYKKLQTTDLPKLWIPSRDRFYPVEALPYLGSGKLDLQALKRAALEKVAAGVRPQP
jgi:acyl-[acyl-carrier-protein]-phospholipid O-acyltransferase / long-chain-fatty-acid--[acyl-carrier-protein] ligase